jgi:hypothetical protein
LRREVVVGGQNRGGQVVAGVEEPGDDAGVRVEHRLIEQGPEPGREQFIVRVLQVRQQRRVTVRCGERQRRVVGHRLLHRVEKLVERRLIGA